MRPVQPDDRSAARRALDEQIAAEPPLPPNLGSDVKPRPMEEFLRPRRHPIALTGIVENGLVRPLDPGVKLRESSRVIIVAAE